MVLLVVLAACAVGVWLAVRGGGAADTNARVTSLLPRDTLAVLHVPDFNRAREQWRQTDIYKLWREPAVQEFLQKPLSRMPASGGVEERMQQFERLGIRDGFVAMTAWENDAAVLVGGFRFKTGKADAEKVIGEWRTRVQQQAGDAPRETVQHGRHRIEVTRRGNVTLATVYDRDWFFAANNVPALTALLDRANSRTADAAATLGAEPEFDGATRRMPENYAVLGYVRLQDLAARLAARLPQDGDNTKRFGVLGQLRSVSAATLFENGKIRDVLFVATPKAAEQPELTRASLALATSETFLYLAMILTLPADAAVPNDPAPRPRAGFAAGLQELFARLSATGISLDEWNSAFGTELGVIGDWPANARIPTLLATLPIKDAAKAEHIAMTVTAAAGEGSRWAISERDGVRYYSQPPHNPLIPVSPTLGLGTDRAILGLDAASVEAAMNRGAGDTGEQLASSERFKVADRLVRPAQQTSAYLDTALLYTRLDAALRPMLIMSAAFVPSIAQTVDLNKVPPAEVITRYLSPIVVSQSYAGDGYITESVGPVSIYHAALGIAAASGAGAQWHQSNMSPNLGGSIPPPAPATPALAPSPSATPDEEP